MEWHGQEIRVRSTTQYGVATLIRRDSPLAQRKMNILRYNAEAHLFW